MAGKKQPKKPLNKPRKAKGVRGKVDTPPLPTLAAPFLYKETPPAPPKMMKFPRHNELTKNQLRFLQAYCRLPSITKACEVLDMDRTCPPRWRKESEAYREAELMAEQMSREFMEAEAWRRGVDGLKRYRFFNGRPLMHPITGEPYYELEFSDPIFLALLRANPKYREHTKVSTDSAVVVRGEMTNLTPEQRKGMDMWEKLPVELRIQIEEALEKAEQEEGAK